jgi:hypothetical protein
MPSRKSNFGRCNVRGSIPASCAFDWDFFRGTMASPMNAFCNNRETARRALFLLGFLDNAEGR